MKQLLLIILIFHVIQLCAQFFQEDMENISFTWEYDVKHYESEDTLSFHCDVHVIFHPGDPYLGFNLVMHNDSLHTVIYSHETVYLWNHRGNNFFHSHRPNSRAAVIDRFYSVLYPIMIRNEIDDLKIRSDSWQVIEDGNNLIYTFYFGEDLKNDRDSSILIHHIESGKNYPHTIYELFYDAFGRHQYTKYSISDVKINEINPEIPLDIFYWEEKYANYDPFQPPPNRILPKDSLVPDFTLTKMDGSQVNLYEQEARVYLLDFWYMSCPPCLMAIPYIAELEDKFGEKGLQIFGINPYDQNSQEIMLRIASRRGLNYEVLFSERSFPYEAYGVRAYPTKYLLDSEKRVIRVFRGFSEESMQELNDLIEELLGEEG